MGGYYLLRTSATTCDAEHVIEASFCKRYNKTHMREYVRELMLIKIRNTWSRTPWVTVQGPQHSGLSARESIPWLFLSCSSRPSYCWPSDTGTLGCVSADSKPPWLCLFSFESQYSETCCPVYLFEHGGGEEQWEESKASLKLVTFTF